MAADASHDRDDKAGGDLAWRQHDGGHDVTPNWPTFFEWVEKYVPGK